MRASKQAHTTNQCLNVHPNGWAEQALGPFRAPRASWRWHRLAPTISQASTVDALCAKVRAHSRMQTCQESHSELHAPKATWPCRMRVNRAHPGMCERGVACPSARTPKARHAQGSEHQGQQAHDSICLGQHTSRCKHPQGCAGEGGCARPDARAHPNMRLVCTVVALHARISCNAPENLLQLYFLVSWD